MTATAIAGIVGLLLGVCLGWYLQRRTAWCLACGAAVACTACGRRVYQMSSQRTGGRR